MSKNNLVVDVFDILFVNFASPDVPDPKDLTANQCEFLVRVSEELSWMIVDSAKIMMQKNSFQCDSCSAIIFGKGRSLGQSIVCSGCLDYQVLAQQVMTRGLGDEPSRTVN